MLTTSLHDLLNATAEIVDRVHHLTGIIKSDPSVLKLPDVEDALDELYERLKTASDVVGRISFDE
jgi:hypothetical protein